MNRLVLWTAVIGSALGGVASADDAVTQSGALREGGYLAPLFSYTLADKHRHDGNGLGGALALGYQDNNGFAAVELNGFYTRLSRGGAVLDGATIDALIFPLSRTSFLPNAYVLLGAGAKTGAPKTILYEAGAGYLLPIRLSGRYSIAVRAEALYRIDSGQTPASGSTDPGHFSDLIVNAGLSFPLSLEPHAPAVEQETPVAVVPLTVPGDAVATPAPAGTPSP